jgi:undecaprenyl diphosphate synthase
VDEGRGRGAEGARDEVGEHGARGARQLGEGLRGGGERVGAAGLQGARGEVEGGGHALGAERHHEGGGADLELGLLRRALEGDLGAGEAARGSGGEPAIDPGESARAGRRRARAGEVEHGDALHALRGGGGERDVVAGAGEIAIVAERGAREVAHVGHGDGAAGAREAHPRAEDVARGVGAGGSRGGEEQDAAADEGVVEEAAALFPEEVVGLHGGACGASEEGRDALHRPRRRGLGAEPEDERAEGRGACEQASALRVRLERADHARSFDSRQSRVNRGNCAASSRPRALSSASVVSFTNMHLIEARNLPRHVGIIMDGNGRWAEMRGQPREAGHKAGSAAVRRVVRVARRLGIDALTLYAFSEQNWGRPPGEVDALMGLLHEYLLSERDEILENGIRLVAIGDITRLPELVRDVLDPLRSASEKNGRMTLALALSYGGREEIATAARDLARDAAAGKLDPDAIDVGSLAARLPSLSAGDPDLIIRTGGEQRLSNFLLFGAAYAELSFTDRLWPDFTEDDLFGAIASYQRRERRFGNVGKPPPLLPPEILVPQPGVAGESIARA